MSIIRKNNLLNNQTGDITWMIILLVVGLIALFIFASMLKSNAQNANDQFSSYFQKGDYDQDGLRNSLDACPCDFKSADKAYLLKQPLPTNKLFKSGTKIDRISTEDVAYIQDYLEGDYAQGLYVSEDLSKAITTSVNQNTPPTDTSKKLFCNRPSGKDGQCTYLDFEKTFFMLKNDQSGFVTDCRTPRDVCQQLMLNKAAAESKAASQKTKDEEKK